MARGDTFTFRVNEDERLLIEKLANVLERSQSDVMRLLIRKEGRQLALIAQEVIPQMEEVNHEYSN